MSQPWTKIVPAEQIDEALVAGFLAAMTLWTTGF